MIPFIANAAFMALIAIAGLINYRTAVKKNAHKEDPQIVVEDKDLKSRNINLPGYNH